MPGIRAIDRACRAAAGRRTSGFARRSIPLLALVLTLPAASPPLAGDLAVDAAGTPPETLAPALRGALDGAALRVLGDGKAVAELWLVGTPSLDESPSRELGVNFGRLAPGGLVGVLRLRAPWIDYRGQPVPAGTFELRYLAQPPDGNHMGVSTYRDFLVLLSPGEDPAPVQRYDDILRRGRSASGQPHPFVMGLFPVEASAPDEPGLTRTELDHDALAVRLGGVPLAIVVRGHEDPEGF